MSDDPYKAWVGLNTNPPKPLATFYGDTSEEAHDAAAGFISTLPGPLPGEYDTPYYLDVETDESREENA